MFAQVIGASLGLAIRRVFVILHAFENGLAILLDTLGFFHTRQ
jgi:hypothetical protein